MKPMKPPALRSRLDWKKILPIAIVLAVGIGVSLMSFNFVISENLAQNRENLEKTATNHAQIIRHSIDLNLTALRSIRGLFDASSQVTRKDFKIFVAPILKRLVGIQALEWIPRVPRENRQIYESAAHRDGLARYTFSERRKQGQMASAGARDEYFPVYYVEPLEKNKVALGFDLGSSAKRLKALRLARDTGKPVATAPITLVQETSQQRAFLVFVPIYRSTQSIGSVKSRQSNLLGFSLGVYRVGDMIEATLNKLGAANQAGFYIRDVTDTANAQLLYRSIANQSSKKHAVAPNVGGSGFHAIRKFSVAGRTWEVVFKTAPGSIRNPIDFTSIAVLLIGLVFTGLIAAYIWAALRRTERVELLVAEKTLQLTNTNQELERSNDELKHFATVASHDLQEPLRNLQAFCGLLFNELGDELNEKAKDYLFRITRSSERMETLIRDLLNYSRISTQGDEFTRVDLNGVAKNVVADLDTLISESGASIRIGDLPIIDADPIQMRQLLQNLIGNSVKYRRANATPEVAIEAKRANGATVGMNGDASDSFQLIVRDNGIGFDNEYAERIFGVFQRLHGRNAYEGTGVGLAICRKIVERHGGTIDAQGEPQEGATFTITMPTTQAA